MCARGSRLAAAATAARLAVSCTCACALLCLLSGGPVAGAAVSDGDSTLTHNQQKNAAVSVAGGRLGVILPVWEGQLNQALESAARWPKVCSQATLDNADLILYKAEGDEESADKIVQTLSSTAGRCFANTKIVYGHLLDEENVYPKGPSIQFYKMFLDEDVRPSFSEYDALSIIEWDVMVAHDSSFEQLYHAAFGDGNAEPFWVKGSVLAGSSFHKSASDADMWHVLGHINGNAIYNNNDPEWFDYVEYTRARWEYQYPYDVALWATISDFPYSWPLWQRYSSKFVATNLIANVGYEKIDADAIGNAVASDTLFIHGSSIEGGSRELSNHGSVGAREPDAMCEPLCSDPSTAALMPTGVSTVCDASCGTNNRFDGYLCGAGDSIKYGNSCRLCYTDQTAALEAEANLRSRGEDTDEEKHVIMCDTLRPPSAVECSSKCDEKKDTVCDSTCTVGRYGGYNCDWRNYGSTCRYCFDNVQAALVADVVAKRRGGRVIMCDTHEPPREDPVVDQSVADARISSQRRLVPAADKIAHPHKEREFSKRVAAAQTPKWKHEKRWLQSGDCSDDCETDGDDRRGRVCDSSCSDSDPAYGTRGCGSGSGLGDDCRRCYNSMTLARNRDSSDNRVIMCDTMAPPDVYSRRQLSSEARAVTFGKAQDERKWSKRTSGQAPKWQQKKRWLQDSDCSDDCETDGDDRRGRVCDSSCSDSDPAYGTRGCGSGSGLGDDCRRCYNSMTLARSRDSSDNRVIMCDTMAPPDVYSRRQLSSEARAVTFGKAQDERKWSKRTSGQAPKWQQKKRWLQDSDCSDDCEADGDDRRGRVCDSSCSDSDPAYGTRGCGSGSGLGDDCRRCYNSMTLARSRDSPDNRVIMCDTMAPPDVYSRRQLSSEAREATPGTAKDERKWSKRTSGQAPKWQQKKRWLQDSDCSDDCETDGDDRRGRVCDSSCSDSDPAYGTRGCGSGSGLGDDCRRCYNSMTLARSRDSSDNRVIMCDTMAPPDVYSRRQLSSEARAVTFGKAQDERKWSKRTSGQAPKWQQKKRWLQDSDCSDDCETDGDDRRGRVCDSSCSDSDPAYGTRGCGSGSGLGDDCRRCYNSMTLARNRDSSDNRVIMCDTMAPPDVYSRRQLSSEARAVTFGKAQDERKWSKRTSGQAPKWQQKKRWLQDSDCSDDCEADGDDRRGRVCDSSCSDSDPAYGTRGCGSGSGLGDDCRRCYNSMTLARSRDSPDNRVIMCDTMAPPDVYASRQLRAAERLVVKAAVADDASIVKSMEASKAVTAQGQDVENSVAVPFSRETARGSLCAFLSSNMDLIGETEATVQSILTFMPGMAVSIAVSAADYSPFNRALRHLPGVNVVQSSHPEQSALMADRHCGPGVELIYYTEPGTLLSRTFTAKDTHSPRGDLLVVYSDGRGADHASRASASAASSLLGFKAPMFTFGTDLILPTFVNQQLRDLLLADDFSVTAVSAGSDWDDDERALQLLAEEPIYAPEMLAALAYSRNPAGIWFFNPQQWVSDHLFKAASIWEIPLVKPRFSCSVDPSISLEEYDVSSELFRELDALANGATCESGVVVFDQQSLQRKVTDVREY